MSDKTIVNIWTDGACRGNPGVGAWGFHAELGDRRYDGYEYFDHATSNKMELEAVKHALIFYILSEFKADIIQIITDSNYVVSTFITWIWGWLQKGTIDQKKNFELILDIHLLISLLREDNLTIKFLKVKSHSNNLGNNRADANCNFSIDTMSKSFVCLGHMEYVNHLKSICRLSELNRFNRIFKVYL